MVGLTPKGQDGSDHVQNLVNLLRLFAKAYRREGFSCLLSQNRNPKMNALKLKKGRRTDRFESIFHATFLERWCPPGIIFLPNAT